eukprot:COSAG01_NODE_8951_length_2605_cov_8.451317_2_plen_559_part_00
MYDLLDLPAFLLQVERLDRLIAQLEKLHPTARSHGLVSDLQRSRKALAQRLPFTLHAQRYRNVVSPIANAGNHCSDSDSDSASDDERVMEDAAGVTEHGQASVSTNRGGACMSAHIEALERYVRRVDERPSRAQRDEQKQAQKLTTELRRELAGLVSAPPRRPQSGYTIFCNTLKVDHASTGAELTTLKRTRWKALTREERQRYEGLGAADLARYDAELMAILESELCSSQGAISLSPDHHDSDTENEEEDPVVLMKPIVQYLINETTYQRICLLCKQTTTSRERKKFGSFAAPLALSVRAIKYCPDTVALLHVFREVRDFIAKGEGEEEAITALRAAADRESQLVKALIEAKLHASCFHLIPFVDEAMEYLQQNKRVTKPKLEKVVAAMRAQREQEKQVVQGWHQSVYEEYIRHRKQKLRREFEWFCNRQQPDMTKQRELKQEIKVKWEAGEKVDVWTSARIMHGSIVFGLQRGSVVLGPTIRQGVPVYRDEDNVPFMDVQHARGNIGCHSADLLRESISTTFIKAPSLRDSLASIHTGCLSDSRIKRAFEGKSSTW